MRQFIFNLSTYSESKSYAKIKRILILADTLLTLSFFLFFSLSGLSNSLSAYIYIYCPNFYANNAIYVVVFILIMTVLFLPIHYYRHFYLEHRFHLSNQSFREWIWDGLKTLALNLIFSILAIEIIYYFLKEFEHTWWLLSTLFFLFFTIFLSRITPTLLIPLFYKLKPVEDFALTGKLQKLAKNAGVKILGIFQMDMSRKTKKANAMFTGLGKSKRIILGDTLISHFKLEEIETVLAHELGHYYYKHIWRFIILSIITSLMGFFLVHKILSDLVYLLGLSGISDIAGLPIFALILFVFFIILMPFQNGYSRRLERQADQFALEQTGDVQAFISAMKKLGEQNLSEMEPHPFIEWLLYDHPSIAKRIKMATEYKSDSSHTTGCPIE